MADRNHGTEAPQPADVATERIAHSCSVTASCGWIGEGNSQPCAAKITCESVPTHFADAHGTKNLGGGTLIRCLWVGCEKRVKRKNFTRHIREPHLGHLRK
ncbi:hypothetical protein J3R83DRAFT_5627 [Lanmaoa asiatica]|nr:hypothetical protein J3R83DRAFT_5627 [Lanmaoa asiatica]